jgi:hypothetical protein
MPPVMPGRSRYAYATEYRGRRPARLKPETVKAYLRSASQKLGPKGCYQTVLAACGWNLID